MILSTLALIASQALAASAAGPALRSSSFRSRQAGAQAFATNEDLSSKLTEIDPPVLGAGSGASSHWNLTIDDTEAGHKQTIKGFGGTVTDATVTVMNALPSDARSKLLRELVTSDGAAFSFLRHTIASSDLSGPPAYTYDDTDNNEADTSLSNFGLGDRGTAMAKALAEMQTLNPDAVILGSPWSAPAWMKVDRVLTGETDGNWLDPQYYDAYASYFVSYLKAYSDLGASISAITLQNEPLNNQDGGHVCMEQNATEAAYLIENHVGPALQDAGFGDSVEIWAYDHNTDDPSYPETVMSSASGELVSATAWHCYASSLDWTVISDFHDSYPSKANHMTECWTSPQTSWDQAATNTIGPLQNWVEASGMWTLGTWTDQGDGTFGPYIEGGCDTCSGLFLVDEEKGTYEFTVDYYVLSQFSKFIPPGSKVLDGTGSYTYEDGTGVQSVATRNPDGGRTVVILNTLKNEVMVHLGTKEGGGETWSGLVGSNEVVTWVLPPASS